MTIERGTSTPHITQPRGSEGPPGYTPKGRQSEALIDTPVGLETPRRPQPWTPVVHNPETARELVRPRSPTVDQLVSPHFPEGDYSPSVYQTPRYVPVSESPEQRGPAQGDYSYSATGYQHTPRPGAVIGLSFDQGPG